MKFFTGVFRRLVPSMNKVNSTTLARSMYLAWDFSAHVFLWNLICFNFHNFLWRGSGISLLPPFCPSLVITIIMQMYNYSLMTCQCTFLFMLFFLFFILFLFFYLPDSTLPLFFFFFKLALPSPPGYTI